MKVFLVILLSMILFACQSRANRAREQIGEICTSNFESVKGSMRLPLEAQVLEREKKEFQKSIFVPAKRYNNLLEHAKNLSECARASQCLIKLTEHERDCEAEWASKIESSFIPGIFIYRSSCKIPEPDC